MPYQDITISNLFGGAIYRNHIDIMSYSKISRTPFLISILTSLLLCCLYKSYKQSGKILKADF